MAWEPDYITVEEFKDYVKDQAATTTDETFIALDIAAASRAIDACCSNRPNGMGARRQFGQTDDPEARYYTPRWDTESARWVIEIDDTMESVDFVTVEIDQDNDDVYEAEITDFVLRPRDALLNNRPYTQISVGINSAIQPYQWKDSARVTTTWGWNAFPDVVIRATYLQTHRFNKRRVSPFGVKGSPERLTQIPNLYDVDPDIKQMLYSYNMVKLSWTE